MPRATHSIGKRSVIPPLPVLLSLLFAPATISGQTQWKCAISNLPFTGRGEFKAVVHDDKLWVLPGGSILANATVGDIWHTTNGADWTCAVKDPPFSNRDFYSALSYNGYIWIMGGSPNC